MQPLTNDCAQSGHSFPNRTLVLSVAQALTPGTRFAALRLRPNMANPGKARSRRSSAGVAGSAAGTPIHVLVVEDHADTRDVLDTLLRTEGYDVTIAVDGVEAIERYRQRPADVVLIDVFMPRKDGIETIRELRAQFGDPLCIAMSADGDPTRRSALDRAREAGARLALRKPIEPWVLLRTLEGAVAGHRAIDRPAVAG
jgi:two-component system, chemotaxis family, chemotaxis protein CheY